MARFVLLALIFVSLIQGLHSRRESQSQSLTRVLSRLSRLEREVSRLKSEDTRMKSLQSQNGAALRKQLQSFQTYREREKVGFFGRYLGQPKVTPPHGEPMIIKRLRYNHGNAYNNTTGYFTAPYSGVYFFAATTGSYYPNETSHFNLYVDYYKLVSGRTPSLIDQRSTLATIHLVEHLNAGQKVWLRSAGDNYWSYYTTFSGFLISPDLS